MDGKGEVKLLRKFKITYFFMGGGGSGLRWGLSGWGGGGVQGGCEQRSVSFVKIHKKKKHFLFGGGGFGGGGRGRGLIRGWGG